MRTLVSIFGVMTMNQPISIISFEWNVESYISNGQLYQVKEEGKNKKVFKCMCDIASIWLSSPCAALLTITN